MLCSLPRRATQADLSHTVSRLILLLGMGAIVRTNDCGASSDQCAMGMRRRESQQGQDTGGLKGQKVKIPAVWGLSRGLADRVSKG
jgi:hypothetical protein